MSKYKYNYSDKEVSEAYDGAVGLLWEALMGDHIHVGGEDETKKLAEFAETFPENRIEWADNKVSAVERVQP